MPRYKQTFDEWKTMVDSLIAAKVGLTSDDLPDWDYYSAWQDGVRPSVAAARAIRADKGF